MGDPVQIFLTGFEQAVDRVEATANRIENVTEESKRAAAQMMSNLMIPELIRSADKILVRRQWRFIVLMASAPVLVLLTLIGISLSVFDFGCNQQSGGRMCWIWIEPPAASGR